MKPFIRLYLVLLCLVFGTKVHAQWIGDNSINNIVHSGQGDDNLIFSCSDSVGNTLMVFQKGNRLYAQKANTVGQLVWGNAMQAKLLSDSTTEKRAARAVYDSANGLYVAWSQINSATDTSIYGQHIDSAGNLLFGEGGIKINPNNPQPVNCATPMLAVANDKSLFCAWTEYNATLKSIRSKVMKIGPDGTRIWGNGKTIQSSKGYSIAIGVVPSNADVFVFFESSRNDLLYGTDYWSYAPIVFGTNSQLNKDIYCQKIINANLSEWKSNGIAVCTNIAYQGVTNTANILSAIPDGKAGAIISFFDYRNTSPFPGVTGIDIYAQRISVQGERLWGDSTVALRVSDAAGYPSISNEQITSLSDGNGGVYVGWSITPTFDGLLFLRHVLNTGQVTWKTSINSSSNISIAKDATNALVVVYDYAYSPAYEVMVLKVSETDTLTMGKWLVQVSANNVRNSNFRKGLVVTPAASGNFTICWTDGRNASNGRDIYASQISGIDGKLISTPNPTTSSVNSGYWTDPTIWTGGMVPNENTDVVVTTEIIITADIVCKSLTVIPPGRITVNPGVKLEVKP